MSMKPTWRWWSRRGYMRGDLLSGCCIKYKQLRRWETGLETMDRDEMCELWPWQKINVTVTRSVYLAWPWQLSLRVRPHRTAAHLYLIRWDLPVMMSLLSNGQLSYLSYLACICCDEWFFPSRFMLFKFSPSSSVFDTMCLLSSIRAHLYSIRWCFQTWARACSEPTLSYRPPPSSSVFMSLLPTIRLC